MATFEKGFAYPDLFGGIHYEVVSEETKKRSGRKKKSSDPNLLDVQTPLSISADHIQCYHEYEGPVPTGLINFEECLRSTDYGRTVHFYIDDRRFVRILRHPEKYLATLSRFPSVIAPDFSVLVGMSEKEMKYSIAASRAVAIYLTEHGIKVIPNVQWSVPWLYNECFTGIPSHSTVAVNCTGIIGCDASKFLWTQGYKELLQRLDPVCIIRYGDRMPIEDESRSLYFPNERIIKMRGGSYGC